MDDRQGFDTFDTTRTRKDEKSKENGEEEKVRKKIVFNKIDNCLPSQQEVKRGKEESLQKLVRPYNCDLYSPNTPFH